MKKVKRAYYEVNNAYGNSVYSTRKIIWSVKEADQIQAKPGFHFEPTRPDEPWHWETDNYQEAHYFVEKHLNHICDVSSDPFLRISPQEFRFLDIRGDLDNPQSCTIILSEGKFEKYSFLPQSK